MLAVEGVMWPIVKTKMLIYQTKANLDEKSLFGRITHLENQKREACLSVTGINGNAFKHRL